MGFLAEVGSSLLLFFLVFGMSATVELKQLRKQVTNWPALLIGIGMQFVILPFVGFCMVKLFGLPAPVGITLMVITSSPGGSYSNWWCSVFNAELALSVTMTALSTLLSTIMLPANLLLYTRWTYAADVVQSLDWSALFISLVVVFGGITCGLLASSNAARAGRSALFRRRAHLLGNIGGISLITLSITVSSTGEQASLLDQSARFYIGVAFPALCGLCISAYFATKVGLDKPERVAVAVEACFQNTGIATSVALAMFSGSDDLATAIGVPLYYGIVQAVMLGVFCVVCWKRGWTKAPVDENVCLMLTQSYQVAEAETEDNTGATEHSENTASGATSSQVETIQGDGSVRSTDMQGDGIMVGTKGQQESPPQASRDLEGSPPDSGSTVPSSVPDSQQNKGALSRTLATLRARATGYFHSATKPSMSAETEIVSPSQDRATTASHLPEIPAEPSE